ncbi:MAG: hypothetical protein II932_04895 [Treponema sp.]|nr:hypothetical protein [Treponema sp.]
MLLRRMLPSVVFSCLYAFGLLSCGLESSHYVDSPTLTGTSPSASSADRTLHYFSFRTAEDTSSDTFVCRGTEIYYRIYNNVATMENREASIASRDDASKRDALVSYGYKTLNLAGVAAPSPLISEHNCFVYIRLADYNTSNSMDFRSVICTSSVPMTRYNPASTLIGIPRRSVNQNYGFDFGRDSSNPVPVSSDADYSSSSATSPGTYYVDAYAVTVGEDTSSNSMSYSGTLFLGSVSITTADSF